MRLLLLCPDQVGSLMAGPGVRYHEMARALAARHDVTLASPYPNDLETPGVHRALLAPETAETLFAGADAIVVQGLLIGKYPALRSVRVPLIVDLYDPMLLEGLHLFRDRPTARRMYSHETLLSLTLAQLVAGDYFLVANRTQRDFYLGMLAAVNRLNPAWAEGGMDAARLIGVVPMGIPAEPPTRPERREAGPRIVWAGGLWEWMDPLTAVRAMALVREKRADARMSVWGMKRPNPDVPQPAVAAQARALVEELGLSSTVTFDDWIPYEQRGARLAEADLGLSLSRPSLEARYAHRARILDYLWAGVPVVATKGDPLATRVARERLGIVVPAEKPERLARAMLELLDHPERCARIRKRIAAVRPKLGWGRAVRPLERFLADPRTDPCRGRLDHLGPLAGWLAGDRPLLLPLVKTGVNLVRHGVWDTLVKGARATWPSRC
jgi:glycosyltransferase involved in cell wall biosynthesis